MAEMSTFLDSVRTNVVTMWEHSLAHSIDILLIFHANQCLIYRAEPFPQVAIHVVLDAGIHATYQIMKAQSIECAVHSKKVLVVVETVVLVIAVVGGGLGAFFFFKRG